MSTHFAGFMGRILLIDLTNETSTEYPWTDAQRKETLGGKILANHILLDHLTGEEKPFSEENWVVISTGPLTGTGAPASVRFEITALSPKTGRVTSSNCGGNFGLYLKKAGLDAVILTGKCRTHRWVEIRDGELHFHDASAFWGLKTTDCQSHLKQLVSSPFASLCIGPAGEDLLTSATVICDGKAIGRSGLGAVLGWKNVKAITASGSKVIPLYRPEETSDEIQKWIRILKEHPLTSDPKKVSSCPGCPIRCKKPGKDADPVLNDLGIDSMDAQNHLSWLLEKHGVALEPTSGSKSGQRRSKLYHSILEIEGLPDCDEVYSAYQTLTDVISASGLCIFAVIACLSIGHDGIYFPVSDRLIHLLHSSTGILFRNEELLAIGTAKKQL